MTEPFTPVGERARWQMVYELLAATPTDSVIHYEDAARILDLEPTKDRHIVQNAIRKARDHLLKDEGRNIESVPNVGYRVVKNHENLRLAQNDQRRSKRSLQRASKALTHADRSGMSLEQRNQFEVAGRAVGALIAFTRQLDLRQRHLAQALGQVAQRTERNENDVVELRQRLDRLEGKAQNGTPAA